MRCHTHSHRPPYFTADKIAADIERERPRSEIPGEPGREASLRTIRRSDALIFAERYAEALEASEEAERREPDEPWFKLHSAELLLSHLGDPLRALPKILAAIENIRRDGEWTLPGYYGNRELALLFLGRAKLALGAPAEAVELFREATEPLKMEDRSRYVTRFDGQSFDLALVSGLIEHRLAPDECRAYLEVVRNVAVQKRDAVVVIDEIDTLLLFQRLRHRHDRGAWRMSLSQARRRVQPRLSWVDGRSLLGSLQRRFRTVARAYLRDWRMRGWRPIRSTPNAEDIRNMEKFFKETR